jgi:hypothetical protein
VSVKHALDQLSLCTVHLVLTYSLDTTRSPPSHEVDLHVFEFVKTRDHRRNLETEELFLTETHSRDGRILSWSSAAVKIIAGLEKKRSETEDIEIVKE